MRRFLSYLLKNHLFLILSVVFLLVFYNSSRKLPDASVQYPRIVMIGMAIIIIWNIIGVIGEYHDFVKKNPVSPDGPDIKSKVLGFVRGPDGKLIRTKVILYICTVLYPVFLPILGFPVTTVLYLATSTFFLGTRKIGWLLAFVAIVFVSVYLVFIVWLKIPFPKGLLFRS
jgi:hypothetical protein